MTQQRSVSWNLPNIRLTQRYAKKNPSKRRRSGKLQQQKQQNQQYYQQQEEQIKSFLNDDDKIVVANDLIRFLYTNNLNESSDDTNDASNESTSSSTVCDPSSHIANDIQLVGVDPKQPIHANRFVLAARSRVLRLMLYGSFLESKATVIPMDGFATTVIQAIVHYCHTNQLYLRSNDTTTTSSSESTYSPPNVTDPINEMYVRRLVQLGQAADYFELYHLVNLVEDYLRQVMSLHPSIACIVYDEAVDTTTEIDESSTDVVKTKEERSTRNESASLKPTTTNTSSPDRNTTSLHPNSSPLRSCNSSYDESVNEHTNSTSSHRSNYPTNNSGNSLSLFEYALRYIECRPYVVLDCCETGIGGIECIHDPTKLEYIFKDPNISASEVFLFRMLQHWYEVHISSTSHLCALQNALGTTTTATTFDIAKRCTNYIQFQNIEPNLLLSTSSSSHDEGDGLLSNTITNSIIRYKALVSQEQIFDAIAQQALRSCNDGIWQIRYRPGHTAALPLSSQSLSSSSSSAAVANAEIVERVLVEGAGNRDVNGMYYRIGAGLNLMNGILYSKREVTCGQSIVYTLSCCTVSDNSNSSNNNDGSDNNNCQEEQSNNSTPQLVREFRIFSNQFLTYRAVRNLDLLQQQQQQGSTDGSPESGTTSNNVRSPNGCTIQFSPMFQPVLQVIGPIYEPDESDVTIPTPIRKYYRIRLSDGKIHMPATLARELSPLVENGDIATNHVIKVLEFGLYQIMNPSSESGTFNEDDYNHDSGGFTAESSTTALHVIKATIVTMAPAHPLGLPISLEEYSNTTSTMPQQQQQRRASNSPSYVRNDSDMLCGTMDDPTQQGLQNLYICRTPIEPSPTNFMYGMDPQQQNRITMSSTSFGSSASLSSLYPLLPPFKIPRTGWEVGDHGTYPVPSCTWIPVVTKKKRGKK